jgi:hypothetical protein
VHGGDGGLDLVGPEGVVVRHILEPVSVLQGQGRPLRGQGLAQGLVVLLQKPPRGRQGEDLLPDLDQETLQLPVPPEELDVAHGEQNQPQGEAQREGVAHGLQGQIVEGEDGGADAQASRQEEQQLPVPPEIRAQDPHSVSSSTR